MYRWLAAAVALGCWGCAFSLDGPDPNRPRNSVPRCDSSKGLVALDGVMATALGVVALAVVSESPDEASVALLPLGIGALYLAGAVSGNRKANACQAALDDFASSYGNERMALDDEGNGAPADDANDGRMRPRGTQQGQGQGPGGQQPYQGYPPYQASNPPRQPPVLPQQQQPPVQQVPPPVAQQPQPQPQQPAQRPQPPQAKPTKGPKAAPPPASDEDDWSDFWREVP